MVQFVNSKKLVGLIMEKRDNKVESRRSFLKKAAYAVPTVVALGQITKPTNLSADSSCIREDHPTGGDRDTGDFGGKGQWGSRFN